MSKDESFQRRQGIAADGGASAAFRSLCNNAATSQGAKLVAAAGYISEDSSADGRFQLVTAIVQLLLDRQQRQQGRAAPQDGTGSAAEAAVEALKRQVLTTEATAAKPASSPDPGHVAAPRPAQPTAASITQPVPSPSPLQPSSSEPPAEKGPHIRQSKQERSNASILALAHTLIAAHAKPQLGESDPQAQRLKKPLVPRRRRKPHRRPSAEGGLDSAASSGSESGGFGGGGHGRPVRQPPCAPMKLPPASRRPAWAQLVHAAPAEQEQALLDWVNSVDAVPAEPSAPAGSQPPTDSEALTRPTSPTEPAQFAA